MKRPRRNVKRSNKPPSQAVIDRRMREVWIDGFGLLPHSPTDAMLERLRLSLRKLADDDKYWRGLSELRSLKLQVTVLMECLRPPRQASAKTAKPTPERPK